jgi:DNA-directed RNA polymerase subunit RPC12/RpoP
MLDEKIKIKCTKCSQIFRERAQKVRDGFQTNCPHCNRLITFDTMVDDRNIRKALVNARELRRVIEASRKAASVAPEPAGVSVMDRSQY